MNQIANMNIVKELLKSETGYRIAKDTGISQSTISRFQTGESKIENMRFSHAITLTNYYNQLKEQSTMKTYELNEQTVTLDELFDSNYYGSEYGGIYFEDYCFSVDFSNEDIAEYLNLPEDASAEDIATAYQENEEKVDRHFTCVAEIYSV